jgi:hypothetical protein
VTVKKTLDPKVVQHATRSWGIATSGTDKHACPASPLASIMQEDKDKGTGLNPHSPTRSIDLWKKPVIERQTKRK